MTEINIDEIDVPENSKVFVEQAAKKIFEGAEPPTSTLISFTVAWAKLLKTHVQNLNPTELRVSCKVVLNSLGLDPNVTEKIITDKSTPKDNETYQK